MELILLLVAGVVIYILYTTYKEYLKNPIETNDEKVHDDIELEREFDIKNDPYKMPTKDEMIRKGEYGIISAILGKISYCDGES